jgi:hypothetical protein
VRETWESLIRDFVRHLKGTNRAVNTQTIYRRAAVGLVNHLEQEGVLPAPRQLIRRQVEGYIGHLVETRSASTANVICRALQQFMKWLLDEEEIDRSPMERMKPPIVPEKPVPLLTEAQLRALPFGRQTGLAPGRYLRVRAREPQPSADVRFRWSGRSMVVRGLLRTTSDNVVWPPSWHHAEPAGRRSTAPGKRRCMHACMNTCWRGRRGVRVFRTPSQEVVMILAIAAALVVLWLLGVLAFHVTAFAIHLLLIAAVIAVIAHFVVGRRSGRTRV